MTIAISPGMQHSIQVLIDTNNVAAASLKASNWDDAVERYKSAGQVGAQELGPAIDEATGGTLASVTHQAWTINGQLHEINSGPFNGTAATQADATKAAALFASMYNLYQSAIYGAPKPAPKPGTWAPSAVATAVAATVTAPAKTSWLPLLGGAILGGIIGGPFGTVAIAIGAVLGATVGASVKTKGAVS